jgi:DNA-binding MarR family transcriptional regulator
VIQQISDRTGGSWKPSPGSVYPTIQQLEDEGLVEAHETDGRRLLRLTDEGRRYVEDHAEEMAATWAPFEPPAPDQAPGGSGERPSDLKPVIGQVMGAMWQVMSTGTPAQRRQAADILVETRRKLYGLLAEGDPERD